MFHLFTSIAQTTILFIIYGEKPVTDFQSDDNTNRNDFHYYAGNSLKKLYYHARLIRW